MTIIGDSKYAKRMAAERDREQRRKEAEERRQQEEERLRRIQEELSERQRVREEVFASMPMWLLDTKGFPGLVEFMIAGYMTLLSRYPRGIKGSHAFNHKSVAWGFRNIPDHIIDKWLKATEGEEELWKYIFWYHAQRDPLPSEAVQKDAQKIMREIRAEVIRQREEERKKRRSNR